MGNSASVKITTGADQNTFELISTFKNGDDKKAVAARFCSSVTLVSGESASYAFTSMPCKEFPADELAPNVALKSNGPAGDILPLTRVNCAYAEGNKVVTLMNGTLVKYSHTFDEDSVIAEIYDDRYLLTKITVFGRMVYDPEAKLYYFDSTSPCIYNRMGFPDLIDTPYGPMFAPDHKFGWRDNASEDTEEPAPGYATTRTRSWRVEDAIAYLRACHSAQARRAPSQVDYGFATLDKCLEWPETAGQFEGSKRTLKDVSVNNEPLSAALQILARKAGAFDIYTAPKGSFNSELKFINMNPKRGSGTRLFLPDYANVSIEDLMNASDIIHSGYVSENVIDYFHDTCIVGDPTAVERFCSTGNDNFKVNGNPVLQQAWTSESEALYKKYISDHHGTVEAWEVANTIWPDVFCAYWINYGSPVFFGTKWSGTNIGARHPRIKPAQLTGYNNSDGNPRNWEPRSIVVEYKMSPQEIKDKNPNEADWKPGYKYDNLTLSPGSTKVYLTALRDAKQTWYNPYLNTDEFAVKSPDGEYDGNVMTMRDIRLNLAIESDWAITGRDKSDPNNTASRINPNGPKFTYLAVAQPMDYFEALRSHASRPNGDARVSEPYKTAYYPAKQTEGHELFTDRVNATTGRLPEHAVARNKDVKKIDYGGLIVIDRLSPALIPGLNITIDGANTIPAQGVLKCVVFSAIQQNTSAQFGPPDSAVIYDNPASQYRPPSRIGSGSISSTKPEDLYYEETTTTTKKTETKQGGDDYDPNGKKSVSSSSSESSTQTVRKKAVTRAQKALAKQQMAQKAYDDAYASGKSTARAEKQLRKANIALENQKNLEADKKEQRSNKGGLRQDGDLGNWLGKPSNGSMTFANGHTVKAGEMEDQFKSYLGRTSDGRFAGKVDLSKGSGLFDTRKADAHSEKDFDRRKEISNAKQRGENEAAAKRMQAYYEKNGIKAKNGVPISESSAERLQQQRDRFNKWQEDQDAKWRGNRGGFMGPREPSGRGNNSGDKRTGESFEDYQKRHPIINRL